MKKLHLVIAMDSFKGSLSSLEAAKSLKQGLQDTGYPMDITILPLADGGEGTVDAVCYALDKEIRTFPLENPFGEIREGKIGLLSSRVCILESASAVGLGDIPPGENDPMRGSSYGVGQGISYALSLGMETIYLGLGGTATNDGGIGAARALGAEFYDAEGKKVAPGAAGLQQVRSLDIEHLHPGLETADLILLTDVNNPLTGKQGATVIFGPQKGLEEDALEKVDRWMHAYAELLEETFKKEVLSLPGGGAAGGLGAALYMFAKARITPGIDTILQMLHMEEILRESDLLITGEGRMDGQSLYGKAPIGVAKKAKALGVPVVAVTGSLGTGVEALYEQGISRIFTLQKKGYSREYSMTNAALLLRQGAREWLPAILEIAGRNHTLS